MQVSDETMKVLRAVLLSALLVFAGFFISDVTNPRRNVRAQNAGTVGIQSYETPVFASQATNACSAIFQDIGQGQNTLFFTTNAFSGTIDLEWSPLNNTTFFPVAQATYTSDTSVTQHKLFFGGYVPNLRACIKNITNGSVSAWYSASSGPVSTVQPGIGVAGGASPPICDKETTLGFASSSLTNVAVPVNAGDTIIVCGFSIAFSAATTTGLVEVEFWSASNCTGTETLAWAEPTTASSPQFLPPITFPVRAVGGNVNLCFQNTSTTAGTVSFSYTSVQL